MNDSLKLKLDAFDSHLPLERARTIPGSWYFDQDIGAAEQQSVFKQNWIAVGRLDQVDQPGAFFTTELAGEPILVIRDKEGELRAFYNVCRHRAARIVTDAAGCTSRLRCPYHGWTYDLAGRLCGVPEFEDVVDFRREDYGLAALSVDTWGPLIFVHSKSASLRLNDYLKPLCMWADAGKMQKLRFVERREYDLGCNWKVFVDNYLDGGYHVHSVHPELDSAIDYKEYRIEVAGHTSVQTSPLRPSESIGKVRSGRAYYWWVFPNLMMNIYDGLMDVNIVLPMGMERCRVIFDFYFDERTATDSEFVAESIDVAHRIQLQDSGICEDVQRGLRSCSYETGRFSVRRERAGHHFHCLLAEKLRSE